MYDRINPPESTNFDHLKECEKCFSKVSESELKEVWISIELSESWCNNCKNTHTKKHPILTDEYWAIGATDNENNLTIQ